MKLAASNEKCHRSESRHHFVPAYPSEREFLKEDAPARSQCLHANQVRIKRTRDSSTTDITRHLVSQAAMSLTTPTSH